jgi:hypothetical protein
MTESETGRLAHLIDADPICRARGFARLCEMEADDLVTAMPGLAATYRVAAVLMGNSADRQEAAAGTA